RRNLIRNVACGNQALREGTAVFRQEHYFKTPTNSGIPLDGTGEVVNELDYELGQAISRSSLAAEEERPRMHFAIRIAPQPLVKHHDSECHEHLPLIFVNSFNVAVKNRVRIDYLSGVRSEPIGKPFLASSFGDV